LAKNTLWEFKCITDAQQAPRQTGSTPQPGVGARGYPPAQAFEPRDAGGSSRMGRVGAPAVAGRRGARQQAPRADRWLSTGRQGGARRRARAVPVHRQPAGVAPPSHARGWRAAVAPTEAGSSGVQTTPGRRLRGARARRPDAQASIEARQPASTTLPTVPRRRVYYTRI
jgi:hypothetical protein